MLSNYYYYELESQENQLIVYVFICVIVLNRDVSIEGAQ